MSDRHWRARPAAATAAPAPALFDDGDLPWLDRADALRAFLEGSGRLPGSGADATEQERRLARWLKSQREAEHEGRLTARRAGWLDEHVPAWRSPREESWHTTARAVGLHVAESGCYPSASSAEAETRRLGTWLRTQRRAHRAGRLATDRAAWLDLNLPFWDSPETETWFGTAELLAEFVADQRRMPRTGQPGPEHRLARWLRAQRAALRQSRLLDEQRQWLDSTVPGWRSSREANWHRFADELNAFVTEHGALPSAHAASEPEQRLAGWLAAQRAAATSGTLDAVRRAWLDDRVPGWRRPRGDRWAQHLDQAAAFSTAHGRLPARASTADEAERRLAAWIAAQRRLARNGRLTGERRVLLDTRLPGWENSGEAAWFLRARALAAFAADHGRLPAVRDADVSARGLAVWLGRQRALANEGRLADSRERWLRLHVPGWRDHTLDAWLSTAARVVAFRAEHGRLPTRSVDAGGLERELGVWLNNQRSAERAGRLAPERRRWLAQQLPDWQDSRLGTWLSRAHEIREYADEHGRLPHARSTSPRAKRLGGWLAAQRAAARAGRLPANRSAWLDAHLPGWCEAARRVTNPSTPTGGTRPPGTAQDAEAARLLQEWGDRLRPLESAIRPDQRRWLAEHLPGWDQQTA